MSDHNLISLMLADSSLPWQHRYAVLRDLINNPNPANEQIVKDLLENHGKNSARGVYEEKTKQLEATLKELMEGPMRSATFVELLPPNGSHVTIAHVLLDDGVEAHVIVPHEQDLASLRLGDRVVLDGKGRVLLRRSANNLKTGEVAQLERRLDDRHIEVTHHAGAEHSVFLAAGDLMEQIKSGQVAPGAALVVSTRRSVALAVIPPENGLSHYQFLDPSPVPDVQVERDIGEPPGCIEEVARHVHQELTAPDMRRRYRLRRCCTKLLCGVSGTGKSLAIAAMHRRVYEVMSDLAGVPIEKLPPRVLRIRQHQILSMWYGQSEKNWQRAMSEALQLADETYTTPDGRQLKLPVLIILEEVDGMGHARGHEAVNDRVLTSVLESLDPRKFDDRLVIVLATTNEPHLVDPALLRRVGGSIENFSRLNRRSFTAVLDKLTRGLPAASRNGSSQREIWVRHIQDLAAWFFSPNAWDPGLVELTYAGSTTPVIKFRRDFLTGALVDRAVQQAAAEAARAELEGCSPSGVTFEQLARAFDAQLRGLAGQLREANVASYTDLPDGVRVATLRRIPQPAHLPFEFHRN